MCPLSVVADCVRFTSSAPTASFGAEDVKCKLSAPTAYILHRARVRFCQHFAAESHSHACISVSLVVA